MFTGNTLTFHWVINHVKNEVLSMVRLKVVNYIELFIILLIVAVGVYLLSSGVFSALGWDHSWPHPQRWTISQPRETKKHIIINDLFMSQPERAFSDSDKYDFRPRGFFLRGMSHYSWSTACNQSVTSVYLPPSTRRLNDSYLLCLSQQDSVICFSTCATVRHWAQDYDFPLEAADNPVKLIITFN